MSNMNFPPSGYLVVMAADRFDFEADVKIRLEEGWKLQGGVSVGFRKNLVGGYDESFVIYAQAMVQRDAPKAGVYSSEKDAAVELGEAVERLDEKMHSVRPGEVTVAVQKHSTWFSKMFEIEWKKKDGKS